MPEANRQTKNQPNESGKAQARNEIPATTIIVRSADAAPAWRAIGRASSAPARYPARLAAPRYTAAEGENQSAAINAGMSGVYAKRASPTPTRLAHKLAKIARQFGILWFEATAAMTAQDSFPRAKIGVSGFR